MRRRATPRVVAQARRRSAKRAGVGRSRTRGVWSHPPVSISALRVSGAVEEPERGADAPVLRLLLHRQVGCKTTSHRVATRPARAGSAGKGRSSRCDAGRAVQGVPENASCSLEAQALNERSPHRGGAVRTGVPRARRKSRSAVRGESRDRASIVLHESTAVHSRSDRLGPQRLSRCTRPGFVSLCPSTGCATAFVVRRRTWRAGPAFPILGLPSRSHVRVYPTGGLSRLPSDPGLLTGPTE